MIRGGGKSFGPVPRDLSISLPNKVRLMGLISALSAKLYEEKVLFIDSEELDIHKSKLLNHLLKPFGDNRILIVPKQEPCRNFELAIGALQKRDYVRPKSLSVKAILKCDYLLITKQGLLDLETILDGRKCNYY